MASCYAAPALAFLADSHLPLRSHVQSPLQGHSDPQLGAPFSTLMLSTSHIHLHRSSCLVNLTWNIVDEVNPLDWIGMYLLGESNPFNYLDFKSHGVTGSQRGRISWRIDRRVFEREANADEARICFKYYSGISGMLRAVSSTLIVVDMMRESAVEQRLSGSTHTNDIQQRSSHLYPHRRIYSLQPIEAVDLTITDISCRQLKRSMLCQPQFYVKISVSTNAAEVPLKTETVSGSLNPCWQNLVPVRASLYFEVKDKARPALTHLVAQAQLPISQLLNQASVRRSANVTVLLNLTSKQQTLDPFSHIMVTVKLHSFEGLFHENSSSASVESNANDSAHLRHVDGDSEWPSEVSLPNQTQLIRLFDINGNAALRLEEQRRTSSEIEFECGDGGIKAGDSALCCTSTPLSTSGTSALGLTGSSSEDFGTPPVPVASAPAVFVADSNSIEAVVANQRDTCSSMSPTNDISLEAELSQSCLLSDSGISQCSGNSPLNCWNEFEQEVPAVNVCEPSANDRCSLDAFKCSPGRTSLVTIQTSSPYRSSPGNSSTLTCESSPSSILRRPNSLRLHNSYTQEQLAVVSVGVSDTTSSSNNQKLQLVLRSPLASSSTALVCELCQLSGSRRPLPIKPLERSSLYFPQHFEPRLDNCGRVFFVDHLKKLTFWEPPLLNKATDTPEKLPLAHRQNSDSQFPSVRRTVGNAVENVSVLYDVSQWPAVAFVTRSDFITFIHSNENAKAIFCQSSALRHIIHSIRKCPGKFDRYKHNRDLVTLLNLFADTSQPMPDGWQVKVDDVGKEFFIDHFNKRTTFVDPRLPLNRICRRWRARSAPEGEVLAQEHMLYSEKVVNFLRQPQLFELLSSRVPNLARDCKLRQKVVNIAKFGVPLLNKYSHDVDLISVLSAFESEILSERSLRHHLPSAGLASAASRRDFESKLALFYQKLISKGYGQGPGKFKLSVSRQNLLNDAFLQISQASKRDIQRSKLLVAFDDEAGLDYGGPSREFFYLLSRELFNPYYGLFEYSANDSSGYAVQISAMSVFVDNFIEWFYFCGRVIAMALINRCLLDTFFTTSFYKTLLKKECCLEDLQSIDATFCQSLLWLEQQSVGAELDLTFSVTEEVGGRTVERELKPGGAHTAVTDRNKHDFIARMVKWRLERGVRKQTHSLLRGLFEIIEPSALALFDSHQLQLALSGSMEIDIGNWRRNTEYRSGYHDQHIVVEWFWEVVQKMSNAQRLRLLQFVTGTSSVPYEGFAALRGSTGLKKFTIEKWGQPSDLPRAHTCFNRLDLPAYLSASTLQRKLLIAVEESGSFAIE